MQRIKKNNIFGYKVGYHENGSRLFIRHFKTYTYSQAVSAKQGYERIPVYSREDNHLLVNPTWEIQPIRFSEVARGIWRENPF